MSPVVARAVTTGGSSASLPACAYLGGVVVAVLRAGVLDWSVLAGARSVHLLRAVRVVAVAGDVTRHLARFADHRPLPRP